MLELKLAYKGSRNYLHGSDFFNALQASAKTVTGDAGASVARLTFRRFARHVCLLASEAPSQPGDIVATGRYRLPDGAHMGFWIVETTREVTGRRPFDEDGLVARAVLDSDQRRAWLTQRAPHTSIESVIALTKFLNYRLMPNITGKWLFGQIDLITPLPDDYKRLEIDMDTAISGRFSVNSIVMDEQTIGAIRFIVGEP